MGKAAATFSGSSTKGRKSSRPYFSSTGFSGWNGGVFTLDPSVRGMQDEAVGDARTLRGDLRGALDTFRSNMGTTRESLVGPNNIFRSALVNPVQEAFAARQGQLQSNLGQRRMGGSSFGQQSLDVFTREKGKGIGEAEAMAEVQRLSALTGIDQSLLEAEMGVAAAQGRLAEFIANVANTRAQIELSIFGLGNVGRSNERSKAWELYFEGKFPPTPSGGG